MENALPGSTGNAAGTTRAPSPPGNQPPASQAAHTLQPWLGFGVMCLFIAIVYAIVWTLLGRRDA